MHKSTARVNLSSNVEITVAGGAASRITEAVIEAFTPNGDRDSDRHIDRFFAKRRSASDRGAEGGARWMICSRR